jgi:hypothetical protein
MMDFFVLRERDMMRYLLKMSEIKLVTVTSAILLSFWLIYHVCISLNCVCFMFR